MTQKSLPLPDGRSRPSQWVAHHERGSMLLLRIMAYLSLRLGRRLSRSVLYCITLYFFCFAPLARRSAREYLRLALGRMPTMGDRFKLILSFATTIHDRVYLLNGQYGLFEITSQGIDLMQAQESARRGALLMGAHLGSFEVIQAAGRQRANVRVAMAMYEDNARKISSILATINPHSVTDIVALGHIDAMLGIAERLEQGMFVGVLADRTLGQEPVHAVSLLGQRALLPTGPMRAAAILRCPVIFMAGLYRGQNRYHVMFESIADFTELTVGSREAAVHAAIERYAQILEQCCRSDPYNWFNFFDFWRSGAIQGTA